MNEEEYDILIVGAGHGGAQTAISLRQFGFKGSIGLLSDELDPPYERPPLSKDYLAGNKTFDRILLRPVRFWEDRKVALLLGRRIVHIDPSAKLVTDHHGRVVRYGDLVWAAGGQPRRLTCEGHSLLGVHTLRTRADVDRLAAELPAVGSVVVIGGGYIGLEAAAAMIKAGKSVTVIEALDRVLARVAAAPLSRFFEAAHRDHGVDVRLNQTVACILGGDRVSGVRVEDGEELACDMVIVGIGIVPSVGPLIAAGASGANGVDVDRRCRTTLPNVYALGDCAAHENGYAPGSPIRLESVQNANDQAVVVAKSICGTGEDYAAVPWFWSNQYDIKLQTVGISRGHDQVVVRGSEADCSFSVVYLRKERVIALDCVNSVKDFVQGRRLVEEGAVVASHLLAEQRIPLKMINF